MMTKRFGKFLCVLIAGGMILVSGGLASADIIAYWTFEGDYQDQVDGNHGTAVNSPGFSSDTPAALGGGQSASFPGSGHVVIANEQNFDLDISMGISTWVKGAWPGTWDPFISKNGEPNGWQIRRNGGNDRMDWTTRRSPNNDTSDFASNSGVIDDGNWHHIATSFDGIQKTIYIDGVLDSTIYVPNSGIRDSGEPVAFGARYNTGAGNTSFDGLIDDTAIFNTPLAPNQAAYLAAGGDPTAMPEAPTTTRWNFAYDTQGWTVLSGEAYIWPNGGVGVGVTASDGSNEAHDAAHDNFVIQSPEFKFTGETMDGTTALLVQVAGGDGNQSSATFATIDEIINYNGGVTNDTGAKGLAIENVGTGLIDAIIYNPGTQLNNLAFTPAELETLGIDLSATYRLNFFDNDHGGWGWGLFNAAYMAGTTDFAVPEPSTFALAAISLLGMFWFRRSRKRRVA